MPVTIRGSIFFCGYELSAADLDLIRQVVNDFPALSLTQLASTICELLDWHRPSGALKTRECFTFLQQLRERGWLGQLPAVQATGPRGPRATVVEKTASDATALTGCLGDYTPVHLQLITTRLDRRLFQEHLQRHHYLGYRTPVGAQLRYFARSRQQEVLACLLFSSAAWRMAARDRWIGWNDSTRAANLALLVNNSRFLILPWVRIPTLASHILSLAVRQLPDDWQARYGVRPELVETLVDPARFAGTCYRAANWIEVGATQGRGRMDRYALAEGSVKHIFLYPLNKQARRRLCQSRDGGPA
jgi:hypothetical protein